MDRRALLVAGSAVVGAGALAACGGSEGAAPQTSSTSASDAGSGGAASGGAIPLSSIPVGGGVVVQSAEVVIAQPSEGTVTAFTAVCPHQGCLVSQVKDNQIVCPCHQSVFSALDGSVQSGPAPQGLAAATVRVENGSVILG